ncbi:hypothetical protein, partial [Chromobacterium haemolyticum]|uniref:hypothetical protein n=1 Tax=Chromobacterium haemolyticum TaxID=394935 RepID=UPI001C3851A1
RAKNRVTRPQKRQFISEVAPNVVAAIMLRPGSLKISGYSRCPVHMVFAPDGSGVLGQQAGAPGFAAVVGLISAIRVAM